jgi:enamine deaminase RidA (YjgF/YER057c/UK114 family)
MLLANTTFLNIFPPLAGNFQSEWDYCLSELSMAACSKEYSICRINIFIDSGSVPDFRNKKNKILNSLKTLTGEESPPVCVLAQPPDSSFQVSVEILLVSNSNGSVRYGKSGRNNYSIFENGSFRQLWCEGLEADDPNADTEISSTGAFESMLDILNKEGMDFDNIIRQWNYIGEILKIRKNDLSDTQNYQVFNEVRHRFYQKYKHNSGFPAATGIGCRYNSVSIGFIAVQSETEYFDIAIDNPLQVNPFAYGQDKLIGGSKEQKIKHPPEFVRGRLISDGKNSVLYVSGTASITGQEVRGTGDIEVQTMTTIQNIKTLVDAKNIIRFCTKPLPVPEKYRYLRVYVKNRLDIPKVKLICQDHFGKIPSLYIEADICRDSLMMEIETELYC